jgi:hypothetical protein
MAGPFEPGFEKGGRRGIMAPNIKSAPTLYRAPFDQTQVTTKLNTMQIIERQAGS